MKPDPFEEHLQSHPLRRIPPEWREEILSAAQKAGARQRPKAGFDTWLCGLRARMRELLWPSPVAWGGLAAIWLLILSFKLVTPASPPAVANLSTPLAPTELYFNLQDRNRILAEFMNPTEPALPAPKPQFIPRPRSEGSNRFMCI